MWDLEAPLKYHKNACSSTVGLNVGFGSTTKVAEECMLEYSKVSVWATADCR